MAVEAFLSSLDALTRSERNPSLRAASFLVSLLGARGVEVQHADGDARYLLFAGFRLPGANACCFSRRSIGEANSYGRCEFVRQYANCRAAQPVRFFVAL